MSTDLRFIFSGDEYSNNQENYPMSWLNNFLAVPAVGIQIRADYKNFINYPYTVIPLIEEMTLKEESITVEDNRVQGFVIKLDSGFTYKLLPNNILVDFTYQIKESRLPGKMPVLDEVTLDLYTNLLKNIATKLKVILRLLIEKNELYFLRIGIVAAINTDRDLIPPGISLLIDHLSKPWNTPLEICNAVLTFKLEEKDLVLERCHHTVQFDNTANPGAIGISLDWQRILKSGYSLVTKDMIDKEIDDCCASALKYFEVVGEGALNYE